MKHDNVNRNRLLKFGVIAAFITAIVLAVIIGISGASAAAPIDYATQVQPLFNSYCAPCHTTSSFGSVRLNNYTNAKASASLLPGMGLSDGYITDAQAQVITDWVSQGALETPPATTYTLTYTAGANGTISGTSPQTVNSGSSGTAVTAVPNTSYHFVSWSDGITTATRTDSNVTANKSVTANFAINTYNIVISASPTAGGSVSGGGSAIASGATVNLGATANTGYHFVNWTEGTTAVSTNAAYSFTSSANRTLVANFALNTVTSYTITASAGANGSITQSGAVTVNSGDNQSFAIAANTGYHVADVLVDGASVGAVTSYNFTNVTANHTISATFAVNAQTTYTITASAGSNGSITPLEAVTVNSGAEQSFAIAANTGYHVADVLVDGVSVGAVTSYNFTNVTANHAISASFAINQTTTYTIIASAGANGSITPAGATALNSGVSQSYSISADTGYQVADVLVDGVSAGAIGSYTFNNVTADHTISVSFTQTPVSNPGGDYDDDDDDERDGSRHGDDDDDERDGSLHSDNDSRYDRHGKYRYCWWDRDNDRESERD